MTEATPSPVGLVLEPDQIRQRVAEMGAQITEDYRGRSPILIAVLKGSVMFLSDLVRHIDLPVRVDFMAISSYGEGGRSGVVRILKDLSEPIEREDVILVEDIIDTGLTVTYLLTNLRARKPRSLEVCALLDKSVRRIIEVPIRYEGFDIPDEFVVGYGLDHQGRYRNLRSIIGVRDIDALDDDPETLIAPYA
ncbi:MAG TPA: hypoxanthine phosphoribosyltransferase [Actinomycetota bacterium]|nr:hypoxanthine phosphoribosyltransferase [Actinomycetota bacterium]